MMENDHQEIKVIASNEEHNLITTKPEEILAAQANIPADTPVEKRKVLIELDLTKGYYKKSTLSPEEIEYLLKNDYEEGSHVTLHQNAHARFLVKKVGWHSTDHTYLLHATVDELLTYTNKVQTDETARTDSINPDIVCTLPNGLPFVFEIETGSNLRHHPDYLDKKVARLNEKYGKRWRFILTSNHCRRKYETRYGINVLLRRSVPPFLKWLFSKGWQREDNGATNGQSQNIDEKSKAEWPAEKVNGRQEQPSVQGDTP